MANYKRPRRSSPFDKPQQPPPEAETVDMQTGEITPNVPVAQPVSGVIESATISTLMREARNNPRSITKFISDATNLVTMNEKIAAACIYSVPRAGKMIRGPSIRFAEILRATYRHIRVTADILDIGEEYVTVRGACIDLQFNSGEYPPVMRRIVDKSGRRFPVDMIQTTVNAAVAIARRNAILTVIPQAVWQPVFDAAVQVIAGDKTTLAERRDDAMRYLGKLGVTPELIFARLQVKGLEDIGLEELTDLRGIATALRDGEVTIEQAFPKPQPATGTEGLRAAMGATDPASPGGGSASGDKGDEKKKPE